MILLNKSLGGLFYIYYARDKATISPHIQEKKKEMVDR